MLILTSLISLSFLPGGFDEPKVKDSLANWRSSTEFEFKAANYETEIRKLGPLLDYSKFPKNHPLYDNSRENALFFLKDEAQGLFITEFYSMRSKSYAFKTSDGKTKITCKGSLSSDSDS